MKNNLKLNIICFILGALMFGGIKAVQAYILYANDINFTPNNSAWKKQNGDNITNVNEAIEDLYNKANNKSNLEIIYTNTYKGNGITFSYTLDNDYKDIYIQADSRATTTNIYVDVYTSNNDTLTKEYDTNVGDPMDCTYDRTIVYHGKNLKRNTVLNFKARYKGTVVVYAIK